MVVHKTSAAVVTHYTLLSHTISLAVGGSVALIAHTPRVHYIQYTFLDSVLMIFCVDSCWYVASSCIAPVWCFSVQSCGCEVCSSFYFVFILLMSAAGCHSLFHHSTRNYLFGRIFFFHAYSFCLDWFTAHMLIHTITQRIVTLMFIIYLLFKDKEFLDAGYKSFDF